MALCNATLTGGDGILVCRVVPNGATSDNEDLWWPPRGYWVPVITAVSRHVCQPRCDLLQAAHGSTGAAYALWRISDRGEGELDVWPPSLTTGASLTQTLASLHCHRRYLSWSRALPLRRPRRTARTSPVASRNSNVATVDHWPMMLSRWGSQSANQTPLDAKLHPTLTTFFLAPNQDSPQRSNHLISSGPRDRLRTRSNIAPSPSMN